MDQHRGDALLGQALHRETHRLQQFRTPDLHPLDIDGVVDVTDKVDLEGIDR